MKTALKSLKIWMTLAVAVSCVRLVGAAPLTLTWNGGAAGNLSDETWSGGEAGHLSPQNGDTLVFSTGGTFTSDIAGLQVAALNFSSSSAVTISGSEKITVLCGGQVRSTGSGTVKILSPIQAGETAGAAVTFADVGSKDNPLNINGNISGAAPIGVGAANGTVEFRGTNTFTGKLSVTNGFFNAVGKDSLGLGTEEAYFVTGTGNGRAKITLTGVTVRMPVRESPGNQSGEITFAYLAASPTTTFMENVVVNSDGSPQWMVNNWANVVFNKKLSVSKDWQGQISTGGKMEIKGEGSTVRGYIMSLVGSNATYAYNGLLIVHVPLTLATVTDWGSYGMGFYKDFGVLRLMVADAFPNARADYGWNPLRFNKNNQGVTAKGNVLDLNGYSQTFACIRDDAKETSNIIKSDSKACVLRLKQSWSTVKPGTTQPGNDFYGEIRGKVSVSIEGSDPCFFGGPNTSTGYFSLTNGATAGFTSTGVWKGTNYVVSAGSTLVVSNTAALLANSVITMADAPEQATKSCLLLGDGSYSARSMTIDGQLLYKGTWGSSQSDAKYVDDVHFKGPGTLTLSKGLSGMAIIFR
ncbi:MAG: hypothetical protein IJG13_09425 [Kiritimatiellae bacterium]|nr:hypothetical protein [Kiritimatiellia bacterium]MBQ6327952.1 hypothetical protein [Kiritimatiellia bacterium]